MAKNLLGHCRAGSFFFMYPYRIPKFLINLLAKKVSLIFTSVPGPKEGFDWNGMVSRNCSVFLCGNNDILTGLTFIGFGDFYTIGLTTDLSCIQHPD